MKTQTTFRTESELIGKLIPITCRRKDNSTFQIQVKAEDVCTMDTIMWTGYFVNMSVVKQYVPFEAYTFFIE